MGASSVDQPERIFLGVPSQSGLDGLEHPVAPRRDAADLDAKTTAEANAARQCFQTCRTVVMQMAMRELARGTPFNFTPVFLALGVFAYFMMPVEPPILFLVVPAGISAVSTFLVRHRIGWRLLAWAILLVLLGAVAAKIETHIAGTRMLGSEVTTRLTGRLVSADHHASGRVRLTLDVISTERPKLRHAPERVRVTARTIPDGLRPGDEIVGVMRLLPPLGAIRPGGYDFAFKSYFDGIGATGFLLGQPTRTEVAGTADFKDRFNAAVENIRDHLAERIRNHIGGAEGEIAAALIAGVRAGIPEDINEALRRTGLAHVLSISGLHMALVAATIIGSLRFAFAWFPRFSSSYPVRKYAALVALAALAIYLFISGNEVAAQRSFIMIAIMLVALLLDHAALTMRNLALAATVVLVVSPHEVVGPSFQMSFAATAALIGAYGLWGRREPRHRPPLGKKHPARRLLSVLFLYLCGLAATSILAGLATTIFGAYHFQRVSPLSLFANLAAMPIVSVLVMPFAVLGLVLMPLGLDGFAFAVMGEGLRLMNAVALWFSEHSPVDAVGLVAPGAVIFLTLALLCATLFTTWLRLAAIPFAVVGIAVLLFPPRPEVFVAENGKLVAVLSRTAAVAVNRTRPNAFTLEGWLRAFPADRVLKPIKADESALWESISSLARSEQGTPGDGIFHCSGTTCVASGAAGAVVVTADAAIAQRACGSAWLLVMQDATLDRICDDARTKVVSRRDLARRGSAMIHADGTVTFAIEEPYRPWHEQRRFSREARGLPPWRAERRQKKDEGGEQAGASGTRQ